MVSRSLRCLNIAGTKLVDRNEGQDDARRVVRSYVDLHGADVLVLDAMLDAELALELGIARIEARDVDLCRFARVKVHAESPDADLKLDDLAGFNCCLRSAAASRKRVKQYFSLRGRDGGRESFRE